MDLISTLRYEAKRRAEADAAAGSDDEQFSLHADLQRAFSLHGRVAVVTGGGKGIGAEAARTFARAGAHVVLADLDKEALDDTVAQIRELGVSATAVPTDVSERAQVDALAQQALDAHGKIDVWANVAGILRESSIVDITEEHFQSVLAVNLGGTLWGCAAAVRAMTPTGRGSIINLSSAAADMPATGVPVYAMSKAGVVQLTRSLAAEVGGLGIRVNAVAPGFIDTPMTRGKVLNEDGSVNEEARVALHATRAKMSALETTGEPSDVAYCMLYLAADASRFVTGQVLRPNGGVAMG